MYTCQLPVLHEEDYKSVQNQLNKRNPSAKIELAAIQECAKASDEMMKAYCRLTQAGVVQDTVHQAAPVQAERLPVAIL